VDQSAASNLPELPSAPPDRLTILYTACLRGRIDTLPRLFSLIKRERSSAWAAGAATILIDLGESCLPGDWLCDATSGRALLVALDALGYDAFFLDQADPLASDRVTLGKLLSVVVTPVAAYDRLISLRARLPGGGSLTLVVGGLGVEIPPTPLALRITLADPNLTPTQLDRPTPDRMVLTLADRWDDVQVGRLDVSLVAGMIVSHVRYPLSAEQSLPPDPTVSGVVDFVLGEARYASRKQS